MTSASSKFAKVAAGILGSAALLLSGCSMNTGTAASSNSLTVTGSGIQGIVHGGQQPIAGAHIFLLAAGTTGYGSASTSLIKSTATNASKDNTTGFYYVTSSNDGAGSFSITNDYTCTAGQYLYLYSQSGDSVDGNSSANPNTQIGLMAPLGECSTLSSSTTVTLNEMTTLVMAYTLAGYTKDPLHVGYPATVLVSGSPVTDTMATTGFTNAWGNITNVLSIPTGQVYPVTLAAGSNGVVNINKFNFLADVLASCVNGATANQYCTTLFTDVTSNGVPTTATSGAGTAPADTAYAAVYMAKNQGNAPAAIFAGVSGTAPFYTTMTTATDLTLQVAYQTYTGAGGAGIASDAYGNVWSVVNGSGGSLLKYAPNGVASVVAGLGATGGNGANGVTAPQGLAIDASNNVWIDNTSGSGYANPFTLAVFSNSGFSNTSTAANIYPVYSAGTTQAIVATPYGMAFDASGNLWVADSTTAANSNSLLQVSPSGTYLQTLATALPMRTVAIGTGNDVWAVDYSSSQTVSHKLYYYAGGTGTPSIFTPTNLCVSGPSGAQAGLSVDASGNAWLSCANGVIEFAKTTGAQTPYQTAGKAGNSDSLAIDSAGNVFQATGNTGLSINEFNSSGTLLSPTATGYLEGQGMTAASQVLWVTPDISGNLWTTGSKIMYQNFGLAAPTVEPLAPGSLVAAP